MAHAVCMRCGASKKRSWSACRSCGCDPAGDDEILIRSVDLSVDRFADGDERRRYRKELDRIALGIRAGESPDFDPAELRRLRKQKRLVEAVPMSAVLGAVFRLFLPVIVVCLVLIGIILWKRLG